MKPAIFTVVFFIALEMICGVWISRAGNSLDLTRSIVVPHAKLGWKQEVNLNETFLGQNFTTDENGYRKTNSSSGKHVLFLGPSSTVGWGVSDEKSYPSVVGNSFAVTNASQIGYSTYQGLELFRTELAEKKFDVTVISYGINDIDFHRFYCQSTKTDADEMKGDRSEFVTFLQKNIYQSSIIMVLQKLVFKGLAKLTPKQKLIPDEKQIRVTDSEFRQNLIELVHDVKKTGSVPLLLLTATHFEDHKDDNVDILQGILMKRMDRYEKIIEEVASAEKVAIADPDSWLKGPREKLFVDPVHFSEEGNRLIGAGLTAMIRETSK